MSMRILEDAGAVPDAGPLADAVAFRERLMELTEASHEAALRPAQPGGLSHGLRAAIAARITRHCAETALAAHYDALAAGAPEAALAEPGAMSDDARLAAILAYVDKVTLSPSTASRADIDALRAAGIAEGDIVRLAGLVAFVNYQLRVALVLRGLAGAA